MRFLRALAVILVVAVVAGVALGTWTVRRSFPTTEGTAKMATLDGPVTVARDDAGVPHISATTLEDLFRGQGYVHAQDRFWQMDTWRHIGAGRLAEMFGASQVETDSFLRTLGFERLAAEAYSTMPAAFRSALDVLAVPSMRMVVDLADFDRSLAVHTTGQSGHGFHSNYFDLVDDWADGRMRPLHFEPAGFPDGDLLRLMP